MDLLETLILYDINTEGIPSIPENKPKSLALKLLPEDKGFALAASLRGAATVSLRLFKPSARNMEGAEFKKKKVQM